MTKLCLEPERQCPSRLGRVHTGVHNRQSWKTEKSPACSGEKQSIRFRHGPIPAFPVPEKTHEFALHAADTVWHTTRSRAVAPDAVLRSTEKRGSQTVPSNDTRFRRLARGFPAGQTEYPHWCQRRMKLARVKQARMKLARVNRGSALSSNWGLGMSIGFCLRGRSPPEDSVPCPLRILRQTSIVTRKSGERGLGEVPFALGRVRICGGSTAGKPVVKFGPGTIGFAAV